MTTSIIAAIQRVLKIFPEPVPENVPLPYAFYTSTRSAIHTKDGIAGYEGTMSVGIVAESKVAVDTLAKRVVAELNGKSFDGITLLLADISDSEYTEVGLSTTELTFNYIE